MRKTKEEAERTRQQILDAARRVFYAHGVGRSSLESVARAAGVTRGAVYWHFKDKADLFLAMREDVFNPLRERTDALLAAEYGGDPLAAIKAALQEFFRVLDDCPVVREVFVIMLQRCECVAEFASVQQEVSRPAREFLQKVETAYRKAADLGLLRPGLLPAAAATDTWAFTSGLLQLLLGSNGDLDIRAAVPAMISLHIGLRRVAPPADAQVGGGRCESDEIRRDAMVKPQFLN